MSEDSSHEVTRLLAELRKGDAQALDVLLPLVYSELRRQARRYLQRERPDHTLQATALVNEAYLKLVEQRNVHWQNRAHFLGVAAQAMRRILIDHARTHRRMKRGGAIPNVTLNEDLIAGEGRSIDLLALDEALHRLGSLDPRQAKVVELRYFGGLSVEESAEVLKVSPATIKRDWTMAKAWLHSELESLGPAEP